jgi:tetratricopeptide (TPR) repeat protein
MTAAFVGVFLGFLIVGMIVVYLIVGMPAWNAASTMRVAPPSSRQQPPNPQSAASAENLPPGHPKVELPAEARSFIDEVEKEANAKPNEPAGWNRLGEVTLRAAMIDPSYYPKAQQAYARALKLDPDSPDALRGIGNLNYDRKNYDQAVAAYEHYLKERPDDPEVRTDLGTMFLYTGNPDQAIVQYKRAIKGKPEFFEAYYNMGIAYGEQNDVADARQAFQKAQALAPDDASRAKVREVMGKLVGAPAAPAAATKVASASVGTVPGSTAAVAKSSKEEASGAPVGTAPPTGQRPRKTASSAAAPSEGEATKDATDTGEEHRSFHGDIEEAVHDIPFAGPKVQSIQWPEEFKANVLMDNFPMDQMPPFAKQKFLTDLKSGIRNAKSAHNIKRPVEINITDAASGSLMESVSQ